MISGDAYAKWIHAACQKDLGGRAAIDKAIWESFEMLSEKEAGTLRQGRTLGYLAIGEERRANDLFHENG
jgi:hypothetical protein